VWLVIFLVDQKRDQQRRNHAGNERRRERPSQAEISDQKERKRNPDDSAGPVHRALQAECPPVCLRRPRLGEQYVAHKSVSRDIGTEGTVDHWLITPIKRQFQEGQL
jgi:hypothetical protein